MSALLAGTTIGAGLLAGVFLAFSVAVLPGLRRRPGREAAATMREINRAIVNPLFLLVFLGTAAGALGTAVLGGLAGAWLPVVGAVATLAGGHVITAAVNIPLNNALDRSEPVDAAWERFAGPWARAHTVRTLLITAGFVLLVLA